MPDLEFIRLALRLAQRGYGLTSPNPMVGAVLVKAGKIIGRGWHHRAGRPHAEIEALRDAQRRRLSPRGATLYVTLEPCSTLGRTPPCTEALIAAGIRRVIIGTIDPNPKHAGKAIAVLKRAGIKTTTLSPREGRARHSVRAASLATDRRARSDAPYQELAGECERLNEAFNHWIVHRTPFVTVKAAMTLDGKIATASGESKWITGKPARARGMWLRRGSDAVLVGINTILTDDPALTVRRNVDRETAEPRQPRRIVLDSLARTPLNAKVVSDAFAQMTTIVVGPRAPRSRVQALARRANVWVAPRSNSKLKTKNSKLNLPSLLRKLGSENVTHLLVEGGGEVNASFLLGDLAHRVAFFYAPKILGGRDSRKGVAGDGRIGLKNALKLRDVEWTHLGPDLLLSARTHWGQSRRDY
jgi:diaminohydroxyphosphoribosylaminopyrimidine deaminase / 5-amino-6-(5-phosphoribosylamino)uracil reductase